MTIAWTLPRARRWALFVTGLMTPLTAAVVLRAVNQPARPDAAPELAAEVLQCDPTRLGDAGSGCPADLHCVAGRCESLRFAVRGADGAACATDLCAPGLECFAGRCTPPDRLTLAPAVCRPVVVQAAIAALRRRCGAARLGDCEAHAWQRMNETDRHFESLLAELPGLFTVHFPADKPDAAGRWATPAVLAVLRAQLADHGEALRGARQVLVVGRASVDGGRERNRELATRRGDLVAGLVTELIGGDEARLRRWSLASEHALPPERFKSEVRTSPVTWSQAETRWLKTTLAADLRYLPRPTWRQVLNAINRVVLVVPLYCEGDEFVPMPAFQGHEEVDL